MTTKVLTGLSKLRKWGIDPSTADGGQIKIVRQRSPGRIDDVFEGRFVAYHENRWGIHTLGACDPNGNPLDKSIEPCTTQKQTKLPGIAK